MYAYATRKISVTRIWLIMNLVKYKLIQVADTSKLTQHRNILMCGTL